MLSTLPRGIVVNSPEITGDIGRINQQPVSQEDIAKLWKVYTTTKRRLRDPTAERLENYWWRIWGSRGRNLCGATVARLFTDISDGHFTAPAWLTNSKLAAQAKAQAKAREIAQAKETPAPQRNSSEANLETARAAKANLENGTVRPIAPKKNSIVPHPILKKTRGPSTHGPRPTARFISPQETPLDSPRISESENEFFDTEDSPNDHVIVRPPTPEWHDTEEDENSGAAGKAKRKAPTFAIAAARNKKRPSLLRRKSSQSSTNSETITKAPLSKRAPVGKNLGATSRHNVISQVQVKQAEERPKAPVKQQDTTTKAPSIIKNRTPAGRQKKQDPKSKASEASTSNAQSHRLQADDNKEADPLTEEELHELNLQQTLLDEANARLKSSKKDKRPPNESRTSEGFQVAHKSLRSKSTSDAGGTQNIAALALHPKNLKNSATLAPSNQAATGTLELVDNSDQDPPQKLDKGKGRAVDELQRIEANAELERGKDMFPKRIVQARPSSTSMVDLSAARDSNALSRSKSQLTLLLERDRVRTNERAKAVGRYSPRGPD